MSALHVSPAELEELLKPVLNGQQPLTPIYRPQQPPEAQPEQIAEGYQYTVWQQTKVDGQTMGWAERRLVIRSLKQAHRQAVVLRTRVNKALASIEALNQRGQGKKCFREEASLREAVEQILTRYEVSGIISLSYSTHLTQRPLRRYGSLTGKKVDQWVDVKGEINEAAMTAAIGKLGWRVYATNQPQETLSLEQAVLAYRSEYLIERGIGRLKNKPLSLTPMYLASEERVKVFPFGKALIRLLVIGLSS